MLPTHFINTHYQDMLVASRDEILVDQNIISLLVNIIRNNTQISSHSSTHSRRRHTKPFESTIAHKSCLIQDLVLVSPAALDTRVLGPALLLV